MSTMTTASVPIPPAGGAQQGTDLSPGLDAPPSLMSDIGGSTPQLRLGRRPTYTPDDLISLAVQTPDDNAKAAAAAAVLPPVAAAKLASVQALLRDRLDSTAWGVSESSAKLLSDNNDDGDDRGRRSIVDGVPFPAVSASQDSKASIDVGDGGSSAPSGLSKYAGLMRFVGTTTNGLFDVVTDKTGLRGSSSSSAASSTAGSPIINLKEQTDAEVLFAFQSVGAADGPAPVLVDFADPFTQEKDKEAVAPAHKAGEVPMRKASYAFQNMPIAGTATSTPSSLPGVQAGRDPTLSKFAGLRAGSLSHQGSVSFGGPVQIGGGSAAASFTAGPRSRSNSIASVSSDITAVSLGKRGSLNPFAPPFPLPKETEPTSSPPSGSGAPAAAELANLPLPKVLPASLPRRPPGPIAPVFVRRESAALPQPMARPDVLPMGKEWEGDAALSGNERRRRASSIASDASSLPPSRPAEMSGSASGDTRPERLQMLGRSLRASVAAKGVKAGSS